jgi:uncharacterized membrane protein SirB2
MDQRKQWHSMAFWLVVGLAVLARLAACGLLHGQNAAEIYTYEHGEIARNLLAGRGFSVELLGTWGVTSQQAPVVPLLLAGCYALCGLGTAAAHWLFFVIQCLQGGLLAAGAMAMAWRISQNNGVAIVAGLMAALHPPLVYAATHIQVVSTASTLLIWLFVALFDLRQLPNRKNAIRAGALMGLITLTDPILALSGVGTTLAWVLFDRPTSTNELKMLVKNWAVLVGVSFLAISPWLVRNYRVHGHFVFIKSTFGYAFWQGNNNFSVGTDKVMRASVGDILNRNELNLNERLWQARHEAGCVDDIALTLEEKTELGRLPELERSKELFRRAKLELAQKPGRYMQLCLRRVRFFLWLDESNPKTASLFYCLPHMGLTVFALAGLCLMPPQSRRLLAPTIISFLLVTFFHALTITAPRFHLPWESLMICWATMLLLSLAHWSSK